MKKISYLFVVFAVIMSDVMCAVVAPASAAFLYIIPYGLGIVFCIILALFFYKRQKAK